MVCPRLKRTAMTMRHDAIARVLHEQVLLAGGTSQLEPKLYCASKRRPDLSGSLTVTTDFALDVTVRHPLADSYASMSKRELGVAAAGATQKAHAVLPLD